jgi:uncharacterized repeat protein (TIGR01451 family)
MRNRWLSGIGLLALVCALLGAGGAGAADPVTFVGTHTYGVPPASNYAGTGGGDGWNVALTPQGVYNVFHHSGSWQLACHRQSDAQQCWPESGARTITDGNQNISTSGHSAVLIDQNTGKLYGFGTRADGVGGVVCVDTKLASPTVDPFANGAANPFCGFTALTGANEAVGGTSGLSEPVQVGSRLFAFNFVPGSPTGPGAQNKLVCFDLNTNAACAGQPFTLAVGDGNNGNNTFPAPAVVEFQGRIIVPITMGGVGRLACFDGSTLAGCSGSWPVTLPEGASGYPGTHGGAFAKLTSAGAFVGFCLPTPSVPCFTLEGASTATPANLPDGVTRTSGWNGASVVVGQRVYIPHGYYPNDNVDQVDCYDYGTGSGCDGFPKHFTGLGLLYSINSDPQRPECLWVNADSGTQIQNFDAFTGGACGTGPVRVQASTFVVATPLCTPGSYTSLQITSPARNTYSSGSIKFVDGSGRQLPGLPDRSLDDTGTAMLSDLNLNGPTLPQFLITLNTGDVRPQEVSVKLTWTGTFDPSCATKPETTVANPPTTTVPGTPAPPAQANGGVTLTPPAFGRAGAPLTFTAVVKNTGPNATQGVVLRISIPAGVTVDSAKSDTGSCQTGPVVTCFIGSLGSGATANVTLVVRKAAPGALALTASLEDDHDTDPGNNNASASTNVLGPNDLPPAPPAPAVAGTFNAIPVGTVLVNGQPVPADQPLVLKSGDIVDVTNGAVVVTSAQGWVGVFSSQKQPRPRVLSTRQADGVLPAIFQITQTTAPDDPVLLTLQGGDFNTCTTPRKLSATNTTPVRALWGSARGTFRTKARYSSATVRGTIWLTQDRCDGSYNQVDEGVVDVLDSTLNKTVTLNAGQNYLAKAPTAAKKPPAQKKKGKKKAKPTKAASKPKPSLYLVRSGDTLSSIAASRLGREGRWPELAKLNGLRPPYAVHPGAKLKLPRR